jgi:hypothetical protein
MILVPLEVAPWWTAAAMTCSSGQWIAKSHRATEIGSSCSVASSTPRSRSLSLVQARNGTCFLPRYHFHGQKNAETLSDGCETSHSIVWATSFKKLAVSSRDNTDVAN